MLLVKAEWIIPTHFYDKYHSTATTPKPIKTHLEKLGIFYQDTKELQQDRLPRRLTVTRRFSKHMDFNCGSHLHAAHESLSPSTTTTNDQSLFVDLKHLNSKFISLDISHDINLLHTRQNPTTNWFQGREIDPLVNEIIIQFHCD